MVEFKRDSELVSLFAQSLLLKTELCLQVCRLVLKESHDGVPERMGPCFALRTLDVVSN